MSITMRCFWCDAPSPLHEAKDKAATVEAEAISEMQQLAESLGAKCAAAKANGILYGFVFAEPPAAGGPYHWREEGCTNDGDTYYVPSKRTKEGKELAKRIGMQYFKPSTAAVLRASGMEIMQWSGRSMYRTVCGWKDGRIFIKVPSGGEGDPFPTVPDYLTECKEWEMSRWFDLGREGVEAKEQAA